MRESKERDVLQLLKDYRTYQTAFGGAFPIDDAANMAEASYGPAGFIEAGMEFEKYDQRRLGEAMDSLEEALGHLARTNFPLWYILQEPYIDDPADASIVDEWRKKAPKSDSCAARIGLHDKAVRELAAYLKDEDLHVVYPKLLSQREEKDIEEANAAMLAFYRRLIRGGSTHASARKQAAENFQVTIDAVQRIVDVRDKIKGVMCEEEGCANQARANGKCTKHYQRERRFKRRAS